jgi:two-component system, NarL family, nitrate/nitrite response regulator NarL
MKILVCDDHALFREGLELVLGQLDPAAELESVGDAETALARVARGDKPDLVLLDLQLPGMDGFTALAALRRDHPEVPVVVLSASENPAHARSALARGASGFIPKSSRGTVLLSALRLVLSGGIYVPKLMDGAAAKAAALTERQLEVLRLLARGLTNREIADVLKISEGTVKTHVKHVYEALDVSNRTEAAMRMRELGLDE